MQHFPHSSYNNTDTLHQTNATVRAGPAYVLYTITNNPQCSPLHRQNPYSPPIPLFLAKHIPKSSNLAVSL